MFSAHDYCYTMKITSLKRTYKNTKRLADIIKTLTKFGFKEVLAETGIEILRPKSKAVDGDEADIRYSQLTKPVRIRMVLEELGPTFTKLGQILATRPDLIPPEWAEEFKVLQVDCTQVPYDQIEEILQNEFHERFDRIFEFINPVPLAAASIAQVHKARLKGGEEVVIKVLRPAIRQRIEEDMALMESLALLMEQYFSDLGYSPTAVAQEFSRQILKEVNLIYEGQSTDKLRKYFADDEYIFFPFVHWQATTRNVLTLQEIKGRVLSKLTPEDLTPLERRTIVSHGTDAVFKQCLRFGFFHADPHPGNIFLQPDNTICFIDCGLTGQLDKKTTDQLINLVAGVIKGDVDRLCRVVIELTNVDPAVTDRREFRNDLFHLAGRFQDADLSQLDITSLLADFFAMLQRYKIQCPSDLLLLTKALTTIEGIAQEFDPEFDVLSHVEPEIREIVTNRYGINAIRKRMQQTATRYLELFEDAPRDIQRFLDQVRHSKFTLNLELKRIEHLAEKIDWASRMMGMAMIISALIVASSILILADSIAKSKGILGTIGVIGLLLSAAYSVGFIASFLLPKKKKDL